MRRKLDANSLHLAGKAYSVRQLVAMSIRLVNLVKRYVGPDGSIVPVVDVADFTLADGEQVALIGTSGSGKTTLLHLIAGILTPDAGSIVFDLSGPASGAAGASSGKSSALDYHSAPIDPNGNTIDITRLGEAQRDAFRGRNIGY